MSKCPKCGDKDNLKRDHIYQVACAKCRAEHLSELLEEYLGGFENDSSN
jgi:hypothetical protein